MVYSNILFYKNAIVSSVLKIDYIDEKNHVFYCDCNTCFCFL